MTFTMPQRGLVKSKLFKLRRYLDPKDIVDLEDELEADHPHYDVNKVLDSVIALTERNLTFHARIEHIRSLESFIKRNKRV